MPMGQSGRLADGAEHFIGDNALMISEPCHLARSFTRGRCLTFTMLAGKLSFKVHSQSETRWGVCSVILRHLIDVAPGQSETYAPSLRRYRTPSMLAQVGGIVVFCLAIRGFAAEGGGPQRHVLVDKSDFRLSVYTGDSVIAAYPIAIGRNTGDKQKRGDGRTPEGTFAITSIENSRHWTHDFKDGKGPITGAYGPWFFRLSTDAKSTRSGKAWVGIGIHGTHRPKEIGTRVSDGCIRLTNEDLLALKALVRVGTRVVIQE